MKKRVKFPNKRKLNEKELERYHRYATDLFQVLMLLRRHNNAVTFFGSRKFTADNEHYIKARELGRKLAKAGHTVVSGGGPGIMEAANRGASEVGGKTIGLNIDIPEEQDANPYASESIKFNQFFSRKLALIATSKVWIFFPGGFGTMDELFEVLTLVRDGKIAPMPIILVGKEFWSKLDDFVKFGTTNGAEFEDSNRKLYKITDDIDEVVEIANQILKSEK